MSNVPTPQPRPAVPRPAPPPLKTDAMEPLDIWAAYAANPPEHRSPPPLPPPPSRRVANGPSVLPVPLLPPRPSRARMLGRSARKLVLRAKTKVEQLHARRRAALALAWVRANAASASSRVAPLVRAAQVPRFSVLTIVLVLVAAWGGAFAASMGARMQKAPANVTAPASHVANALP